jgi:hypothetical protein
MMMIRKMVPLQHSRSTMSAGRNTDQDRERTLAVLSAVSGGPIDGTTVPNWRGHTKGAAALDGLLLCGTTMARMRKLRGAVREHLDHLQDEHGLSILETNGVYRLAVLSAQP